MIALAAALLLLLGLGGLLFGPQHGAHPSFYATVSVATALILPMTLATL